MKPDPRQHIYYERDSYTCRYCGSGCPCQDTATVRICLRECPFWPNFARCPVGALNVRFPVS